jgi:hypothetical protein
VGNNHEVLDKLAIIPGQSEKTPKLFNIFRQQPILDGLDLGWVICDSLVANDMSQI